MKDKFTTTFKVKWAALAAAFIVFELMAFTLVLMNKMSSGQFMDSSGTAAVVAGFVAWFVF